MVTIASQFNGPPTSGNGGYVSGLIAQEVSIAEPVQATLKLPPPLDVALAWEHRDTQVSLVTAGGAVVGLAEPADFDVEPPGSPSAEQAAHGHETYLGYHSHPFDHCFTCGTARDPGDGLRIFTGPISEKTVATHWSAHPNFADASGLIDFPTAWAAIDCPGGWAADFTVRPSVLGKMTAHIMRRPAVDEPVRLVGLLREQQGRKLHTASAMYSDDGELLGRAEQTWIMIDPANFA